MENSKANYLLYEKPFAAILKFSLFFIIGDLFQQLYNVVDSIIVGKFVSTQALAAIGVASPIMSLVMFMIIGFTIGSGILFSRFFGEKDYLKLKKSVSTALFVGLAFTLVVSVFSFALCKPFLILLQTPNEILKDTLNYLYIIFAANIFTFLYNFFCYAIRSIGDSFVPLVFLIVSIFINAVLDLLFVLGFNMGIQGAAFATLLAQIIASIMVIIYTYKKVELIKLGKKDFVFDTQLAKSILSYSSAVSLQQTFVYIGRISVQGLFNSYGTEVIAGVNAAEKINALFQTPFRGYANALTTYYSQNLGAKQIRRIFQGYKTSWIMVFIMGGIFSVIGCVFSDQFAALFMQEESTLALEYGSKFIWAMSIGFVLAFIIVQHQSFMRGMGYLKIFFFSTVIAIVFRIIFSYLFDHIFGLDAVFYAPVCSWVIGLLYNLICMIVVYKKDYSKQN